jgi:hypothetical protein
MINLRRGIFGLLMAGALLAGCDDDDNNGPSSNGTELTAEERAALATAFTNTGLIPDDPQFAPLYGLLLGGIQSYGTVTVPAALRAGATSGVRLAKVTGEYDATAVQYLFDISINGEPVFQGVSAGIVAWSGLDVAAETVDDWINIGGSDDSATEFPETLSGTVPEEVYAAYYLDATETLYEGISGSASITASSFSGSAVDCTIEIPTIGTLSCSYRYGSQEGDFDFVAAPLFTEGENVTFASTSYDLPAVRVSLSGDLTVPVGQVASVKRAIRTMVRMK